MNTIALALDHLAGVGGAVWRASWQASVLAVLVFAVQLCFGRYMPARWRHRMWMLVLIRLALPVVPSSPLSVFNLAPRSEVAKTQAAVIETSTAMPLAPVTVHPLREVTPTQAPTVTPVRPEPIVTTWTQRAALIWFLGIVLLATRVAIAIWRAARTLRQLDPVADERVLDLLRLTAAELRIARPPTLLAGDDLFSPALVGCICPRLLLPRDLLRSFDDAELRLIFLHELAHLKRRDIAVNWLATLLSILHWPNPVVWLVVRRLRLERELACDEMVLSRSAGADRATYGHSIVKLLETYSRAAHPVPGGVGILEGKQQMKRRITMIAKFAKRARAWTVVAAVLVIGLGVVSLTDAVRGQSSSKEKSQTASEPSTKPTGASVEKSIADRAAKDSVIGANDLVQIMKGGEVTPEIEAKIMEDVEIASMQRQLDELEDRIRRVGGPHAPAAAPMQEQRKTIQQRWNDRREALRSAYLVAALHDRPKRQTIGEGELVTVSIMDLVGPGVETRKTARVDSDGNISLPYVGLVKAQGLRPVELEKKVAETYKKQNLLNSALVVVSLPDRGESHSLDGRRPEPTSTPPGVPVAESRRATSGPAVLAVHTYEVKDLLAINEGKTATSLADVLQASVEGESWRKNGGEGSVTAFGTTLVVSAPERVHDSVKKMLKMLRDDAAGADARPIPAGGTKSQDMTLDQIARIDSTVQSLVEQKTMLKSQLGERLRRGETTEVAKLQKHLKTVEEMTVDSVKTFKEKYKGYYLTSEGGMAQRP